jgi:hypothetical protein
VSVKNKFIVFLALLTVLAIFLLFYQLNSTRLDTAPTEGKGPLPLSFTVDKTPLGTKKINSFDTTVDDGGRIHLAVDDGLARYYLWSDNGGALWSKPVHVADGPSSAMPGNDIRFAVKGSQQIIVWKENGELPGWGRAQMAVSNDAGLQWQPGKNPVEKDISLNQGYFSLLADQNNFHLLWLDDRKESGHDMQLRYSQSSNGLNWQEDTLVDNSVCTCCWLSVETFEKKIFALYRGTTPRDMKIAAYESDSKGWDKMGRVGEFDWHFTGCPHQGGAFTVSTHDNATIFHSVVFTGHSEMLGLHYLFSLDQGASWQYKQPIGNTSARHVDIATVGEQVFIAWQEIVKQQHYIKIMQISPNREPSTHYHKKVPGYAYPRIVAYGNTLKLFWLEKNQSNLQDLKMTTLSISTNNTTHSGIIL